MRTVIVLRGGGMGAGDEALGERILLTFLHKAGSALPGLEAILLYNAGVKLICEGSAHLAALTLLEEQGVDVIACGTCVDHFGLRERVRTGTVGNMDQLLQELAHAEKVITL